MNDELRMYLDEKFSKVRGGIQELRHHMDEQFEGVGEELEKLTGISLGIAETLGPEVDPSGEGVSEAKILSSYRQDIDQLARRLKALEEKR